MVFSFPACGYLAHTTPKSHTIPTLKRNSLRQRRTKKHSRSQPQRGCHRLSGEEYHASDAPAAAKVHLTVEMQRFEEHSPVECGLGRSCSPFARFTEHGFLNIDNNASERALRAVAVGRKNYLFCGSDAGGRTAGVLYTMTQTCRRHGLDPFAYLQDVLTRLPSAQVEDLPLFLPNRWSAQPR